MCIHSPFHQNMLDALIAIILETKAENVGTPECCLVLNLGIQSLAKDREIEADYLLTSPFTSLSLHP